MRILRYTAVILSFDWNHRKTIRKSILNKFCSVIDFRSKMKIQLHVCSFIIYLCLKPVMRFSIWLTSKSNAIHMDIICMISVYFSILCIVNCLTFDCRCCNNWRIDSCNRYGHVRAGIRNECTAWIAFFPNTPNGSDGSARRHLEITRKRCICS